MVERNEEWRAERWESSPTYPSGQRLEANGVRQRIANEAP